MLFLPLSLHAQRGSLTFENGETITSDVINLTSLADPDQQVFYKKDGQWQKAVPAHFERIVIGADTFETRRLDQTPIMMRRLVSGPLSLYEVEESFMHTFLVRHKGESNLGSMEGGAERQMMARKDTGYGAAVPVLVMDDGQYLVCNPVDRAGVTESLRPFLSENVSLLSQYPGGRGRIQMSYFEKLCRDYNRWKTAKLAADEAERQKKGTF